MCISWNIFNRIHFFAICDVFLFAISSFLYDIYIWLFEKLTKQLRQTFFFIIYNLFHIANQLYEDSHTSRTITSSQHHPRETRPLLSQPNLYKNRYIGFAYYEFVSYIARNASMFLLIHFLSFSYFFFPFLSTSYIIWSWVNLFAYSFFSFSYFFFLSFNFILYMKLSQSICLFIFYIQLFLFLFFIFILYMKWVNLFAYFFSHSAISFPFLQFHIIYEVESIYLLIFFLHSAISFPFFNFILIWNRINLFAQFFSRIQLFLFLSFIFILYMKSNQSICLIIFNE